MDKQKIKNFLQELYIKIKTEDVEDENSKEFVNLLLEQITTCSEDPSDENMSFLMDMLHAYSLAMTKSAFANDAVALHAAHISDISREELEKFTQTLENMDKPKKDEVDRKTQVEQQDQQELDRLRQELEQLKPQSTTAVE